MQHGSMIEQRHRCRHSSTGVAPACARATVLRSAHAGRADHRALQRIAAFFTRCSGSHRHGTYPGASRFHSLSHPHAIGEAAIRH
jgi:hypothetical protein